MRKGLDFPAISVSFLCHDGQGHYVLEKRGINCRDEHGTWDGGGGSLELNETIEESLRREIKEELCADAKEIEFLGYRDVFRDSPEGKTHWVQILFKVLVDPAQVRNGEPHKFDEIGWFSLDDLPTPLHSQLPLSIAKYRDRL